MLGGERKEVHTERNLHKVACDIFEAEVREPSQTLIMILAAEAVKLINRTCQGCCPVTDGSIV